MKLQKTYSVLAWIFSACVVFAIYDANTGGSVAAARYIRAFAHGDKIAHFTLFGWLSFLLNLACGLKQFDIAGYSVYRGTLIVSVIVVVEEMSQRYIPTRSFDYFDLMADYAGILVFVVPTILIAKRNASTATTPE